MKKTFVVVSCLFLFASCGQPTTNEVMTKEDQALNMEDPAKEVAYTIVESVPYMGEDSPVRGYYIAPKDGENMPAMIAIHEWWGLNDEIKSQAKRFAEAGYAVLAVDLYDGGRAQTPDEARALATSVRENMEPAFDNLKAAVAFLKQRTEVDSTKLASVGWCFGGQWSYEMARNNLGVDASVMYYGRFNPADDFSMMKAQILGHFGEDDASIKVDDVKEFEAVLNTLGGDHAVYIYPNAGHAFANEEGDNYNEEAADLAWQRTMEFLKEHVK